VRVYKLYLLTYLQSAASVRLVSTTVFHISVGAISEALKHRDKKNVDKTNYARKGSESVSGSLTKIQLVQRRPNDVRLHTCHLTPVNDELHCKNIRIFRYSLWRVFHILTEPVPFTFVSVNRRNNEARAYI